MSANVQPVPTTSNPGPSFVGVIIGALFRGLVKLFKLAPRTWLWIILAVVVASSHGSLLAGLLLAAAVVVNWSDRGPRWISWVHFISSKKDWQALQLRRKRRKGNKVLREIGLVNENDLDNYAVWLYTGETHAGALVDRLWLRSPSGNIGLDEVTSAAERAAGYMGAVAVQVTEEGAGYYNVRWFDRLPIDPLSATRPLTQPHTVTSLESVPYATDEDGKQVVLNFQNKAAAVIGGVPGSGKSAGCTTICASLAPLPNVQFLVIDGKGGSDWEWIAPRATWLNDDDDFTAILAALDRVTEVMRERVSTLKALTGTPNLWHTGPTVEMPLMVVVVDECQTFFDLKGILSKEKKIQGEAITARIQNLVKKGRSAGIFVFLLTQKPTADSLPTGIRDNASLRFACRVMTPDAEVSILGDRGQPSAVDLPAALAGAAIIQTESGDRARIRFDYLPDNLATAAAEKYAHLRRDL